MIEIDQAVDISTDEVACVATEAFRALGLGAAALHAITDLGYSVPTSIQEQTIPLLLAGHDIIGQAPTGTGETAAYGLPLIEPCCAECGIAA